jgi:hypothetical protein
MPIPGLDKRLDQHARRSGVAVGLTMAATIALCVLGFSLIYASIEPLVRDFVDESLVADARAATKTPAGAVDAASADRPTKTPKPTRTPRPAQTSTPTIAAFTVTHYSNPELRVNLRPEPGTDNVPVAVLNGATPLQALGDEETGPDGARWLKFRTQDGKEGWLREGTFVSA